MITAALIPGSDGETIGVLIGMGLIGAICASIASARGRSPVGWFFFGAFFGCLALILVLTLPDLKKIEAEKGELELANRQLREQLAKDRAVADLRHDTVERRLGAHDEVLQLDTSNRRPTNQLPPVPVVSRVWYYAAGQERRGPFSIEEFRSLVSTGTVTLDTLVWSEGMSGWQALRFVESTLWRNS